jgi:hypothetical protein
MTHKNLRLTLDPDPNHSNSPSLLRTITDACARGYAVTFQPVDAVVRPSISLVVYDMTVNPVNRMGHITTCADLEGLPLPMQEEHFIRAVGQCVMFLEGQRPVPS